MANYPKIDDVVYYIDLYRVCGPAVVAKYNGDGTCDCKTHNGEYTETVDLDDVFLDKETANNALLARVRAEIAEHNSSLDFLAELEEELIQKPSKFPIGQTVWHVDGVSVAGPDKIIATEWVTDDEQTVYTLEKLYLDYAESELFDDPHDAALAAKREIDIRRAACQTELGHLDAAEKALAVYGVPEPTEKKPG